MSTKTPTSFLGCVAAAYADRYDEMSDICFVFPNKRSTAFFLKNLSENLRGRTILAPEVMDIGTFMTRVSGLEPASRIDMLFRLYKVYCRLRGVSPDLATEENVLDFDRFAPWGETLIGDFSEVDQYDVDAVKLFSNVREFRSIESNFLTEDQIEIIERYFGYRPVSDDVEKFWKTIGTEEERTRIQTRFVELWELLPELYEGLCENLAGDGLALPGTTFRESLRKVREEGSERLPWSKVVVVGFNHLSTTEACLFAELRKLHDEDGEPYAEFFWDATGPVLGGGVSKSPAVKSLRTYMRNFPMPDWAVPLLAGSERADMPEITEAAAPSNVAQVKIAAMTLNDWIDRMGIEEITSPRTAIIVPDENLLMPLVHSLPPQFKSVNLTMGYSLRFTAVSSFIYHLRRLQSRKVTREGTLGYLYDDLSLFLAHPLVHAMIGTDVANTVSGDLARRHLRVVTIGRLESYSEALARLVRPLDANAEVKEVIDYLDEVLRSADNALNRENEGLRTMNSRIERSQIEVYRLAMSRLLNSVRAHGLTMNWKSVLRHVDRLVSGEKVTFEGEPLEGLQVMGLLETRALDFDNLIILSMNDKIMPRGSRRRTFVPDSLRRGFGLPTSGQSEILYSYYFYRLLSRARNVSLIYDARAADGMRSGGKSRFLMQLEMLYARDKMKYTGYTFRLDSRPTSLMEVRKTGNVMKMLDAFLIEGKEGRNLSASALMNYSKCQVKFYYKNVVNMNDDVKAPDYIDPITQGNILHQVMFELYFPEDKRKRYLGAGERIEMTYEKLRSMLDDKQTIRRILRRAVNKEHFDLDEASLDTPLSGTVEIVAERLRSQVEDILRYDMTLAPFELIGGELTGNARMRFGNSPEVNLRYAFDRVDCKDGEVRIVDYKTGGAHVTAGEFDEVFDGSYNASYMLQLLLYSHLLIDRMHKEEGGMEDIPVSMHIYDVNVIGKEGSVIPKVGKTDISDYQQVKEKFVEGMETIINDIFDKEKPFRPTDKEDNCTFCAYKSLCGRE